MTEVFYEIEAFFHGIWISVSEKFIMEEEIIKLLLKYKNDVDGKFRIKKQVIKTTYDYTENEVLETGK